MFTRGFSEANQQKIPIQEIDAGCMEEILKYAYSGAVEVNKTNVRELYLASDLLQVEHVQNTCVQFMVNQVDINTCVASYQFAQAYGIPELLQAAKACICRKFLKLSQTQELLELPLSELKDILSSDDLDIKNELVVLQTVESWVNYNREERMAQLEDLAQVVRFNLISPSKIPELFSHLEVVKCARVARHSKKGSTPSRLGMDAKEMIVFFGSDFPYGSMYTSSDDADDVQSSGEEKWTVGAYDPGTKTLYKVSDSGNSCPSAVAVVPEESVWYAIYHSDPVSHTLLDNDQQRFMMYDAVNNQWIDKCPPLFKHTSRCSLDCVNSKIYLIGDTDDADGQNMSWFDPMWNQWTAVAAFPEHLGYNFHTASIDQYIYLITSDVFYRFDTTTDQWRKLSTGTKNDKRIIGVWAHEGKFFCIYEYHDVYVYSPEWHSWHLEEPKGIRMPLVQQLFRYKGQLHAVTTEDIDETELDHIQIYRQGEMTLDKWTEDVCRKWYHVQTIRSFWFCESSTGYMIWNTINCFNARLFPSRLNAGQLQLDAHDSHPSSSESD
ncbi:kelch repeat and BTB domain-containing protein 8-like isoform X2 [Branchiostoma lanceolatum]|nr:KBTBD8 [Branchiostoma lanceolatum]